MPELDPQAQKLLDAGAASGLPPVYRVPISDARTRMHMGFTAGPSEPILEWRDLSIPGPAGGITVRTYRDSDATDLPLVVFFHGGGWTVNDLDTHDRLCTLLARHAACLVASVDYRRAPEAKYPAAFSDAWDGFVWCSLNARQLGTSSGVLAVAGDSSGATLAATVALRARDWSLAPRISAQLLLYPATDYLYPQTASYKEFASGYSLDFSFMEWSWRNYLPDNWSISDPYLFPLRATDLSGLPAAVIQTANFDPLRDEGKAFADRLQSAGVSVTYENLETQMHGYAMQTRAIDAAADAVLRACAALRSLLEPSA